MIKRRTIGLAAATVVLGGLGAYGATAFAADPSPSPKPSSTQTAESGRHEDSTHDREAMIRHCTDQLPAADREKARQQMERMMSDGMMSSSMTGDSMMGGTSQDGHHGMG
ncbi:hypothetical protein ABZ508_14435 [Streptomyces lavendulocolor]|uniref:Uncharacterized protein n=1 Tax=Streptomyces lavendulocolor TaxID=67316 RepID=A0ABV2W4T3_9ACTN|nr:hypothetical protein GCM10018771_19310 [Streptomyces cellulosae]